MSAETITTEGLRIPTPVSNCSKAEGYFKECISQIKTGKLASQYEITIYYNAQRVPLLIQKGFLADSGLTLQTVHLTDPAKEEIIPPLSIVSVSRETIPTHERWLNGWNLNAVLVEEPLLIMPMRPARHLKLKQFQAISAQALNILEV